MLYSDFLVVMFVHQVIIQVLEAGIKITFACLLSFIPYSSITPLVFSSFEYSLFDAINFDQKPKTHTGA